MFEREIVIPAKAQFVLQSCDPAATLAPHELRGRTIATLVSPGTELAWAMGEEFPVRPGYAAVFEVEEIGSAVTSVEIGEQRFCMGAHRSFQQADADLTVPLRPGLSPENALLARLMGVSMTTLMTTRARPGDTVFVCGAGPVGYLAAHIFRLSGYEVSVVEPDARRRAQAEASGLTSVYPAMPLDHIELVGDVAMAIDCSGHEQAVMDACRMVRQHGEVVLVGVPWRRQTDLSAHAILQTVFEGFVHLRSGWEWELPLLSKRFKWEELTEGYNNSPQSILSGFRKAMKWLSEDRIPIAGMFRKVRPEDAAEVYGALKAQQIEEPFVFFDWLGLGSQQPGSARPNGEDLEPA